MALRTCGNSVISRPRVSTSDPFSLPSILFYRELPSPNLARSAICERFRVAESALRSGKRSVQVTFSSTGKPILGWLCADESSRAEVPDLVGGDGVNGRLIG